MIENHDLALQDLEELGDYVNILGYDIENNKIIPSTGRQILTSESKHTMFLDL